MGRGIPGLDFYKGAKAGQIPGGDVKIVRSGNLHQGRQPHRPLQMAVEVNFR